MDGRGDRECVVAESPDPPIPAPESQGQFIPVSVRIWARQSQNRTGTTAQAARRGFPVLPVVVEEA
jgi:hypothetical protein